MFVLLQNWNVKRYRNLWNYFVRLFELLDFSSNKKKWRICEKWMQVQLIEFNSYPFLQSSAKDNVYSFYCTVWDKKVSCKHQAMGDVRRHIDGQEHKNFTQSLQNQPKIQGDNSPQLRQKVIFSNSSKGCERDRIFIKWTHERDSCTIS